MGHDRGQDGLEEEHQTAIGGAGLFDGHHVEDVACRAVDDADEEEVGEGLQGEAL